MRPLLLALSLSTLLGAAGCGPVNRGLESVNQPIVSRTDYAFDISAVGLRSADDVEARRLDAWFDALGLRYGDRVSLDDPRRAGDGVTREAISEVLARHGLLLDEQPGAVTGGPVPAGALRVVVSRASAEVPDCPNWSRQSQPEFAASTMSNYGCAVNSTLAAMVASPEDLVRGRSIDDSDARTINKAVKLYRDATPTGKEGVAKESTKSGGQ